MCVAGRQLLGRRHVMDVCLSCCLCHCRRTGRVPCHKFMHAVHKIQIKGAAAAVVVVVVPATSTRFDTLQHWRWAVPAPGGSCSPQQPRANCFIALPALSEPTTASADNLIQFRPHYPSLWPCPFAPLHSLPYLPSLPCPAWAQ